MIIQLLIILVLSILQLVFSFLPDGSQLPWGTDGALTLAVGWLRYIEISLWPVTVIINVFIIYALFRLGLLLLRLLLGHRSPKVT